VLASLAPGTVPLQPAGYTGDATATAGNGLYEQLFGKEG
jgi:hypothetical protein